MVFDDTMYVPNRRAAAGLLLSALCSLSACFSPDVGPLDTENAGTAGSGTAGSSSTTEDPSITTAGGACGDGVVDAGEDCDDGNEDDVDTCKSDCTRNVCGDGVLRVGVEECDDGNTNDEDSCRSDCTNAVCGDGVHNVDAEQCDDGNGDETDACKSDCTLARCGDGIVQEGIEECDDGDDDETDQCTTACTAAACGDGFQQADEACDDGNPVSFDGCSSACVEEPFCYGLGTAACPSQATQYCTEVPADCESEASALIACEACMGPDSNCTGNVQVCNEARAARQGNACPDSIAFVYITDICSAGTILDCNGANAGNWCTEI